MVRQEGKVVFVVNPFSALGETKNRFEHLRSAAHRLFPDMEALETQHAGHATQLAADAIDRGAKVVVAVGGDGTFNEVMNGFFDANYALRSPNTQLALLPSGTGGDFCRSLGRGLDFSAELKRIQNGRMMWIDVGKATVTGTDGLDHTRLFLNIASLGLSAQAAQLLEETSGKFGKSAYFMAAARAVMGFHRQTVRLVADKESMVYPELSLLAIANGQYFGGGMKIAPGARLDDGYFEQVAVSNMGFWFFLRHGLKVYSGNHVDLPQVAIQRSRRISVEAPKEPVPIELDGEPFGCLPAKFEIIPRVLPLVV